MASKNSLKSSKSGPNRPNIFQKSPQYPSQIVVWGWFWVVWERLGGSWGVWEHLGGVLGASWGRLGAILGPSWGRLGPSWGRLGRF